MTEATKPATRSTEVELEINAPVEAVWKALTEAEEIKRWFALDARVQPGPGGSIQWSWGELMEWESRIEVWEPKRFLRAVYTTSPGGQQAGSGTPLPLAMDFILGTRGGKTVLRLVHSGFGPGPDWDDEYDGVRRGWQFELRSLRHYLEQHWGVPRRHAWARAPVAVSFEEGWKRLTGATGFVHQGRLNGLREGDRYSITAATGETFAGTIQIVDPPVGFSATVDRLNRGLLRGLLDSCGGKPEAWVWLSAWGLPQPDLDAFQARWQAQLEKLFPEEPKG